MYTYICRNLAPRRWNAASSKCCVFGKLACLTHPNQAYQIQLLGVGSSCAAPINTNDSL